MDKVKAILSRSIFLFFAATLFISVRVTAADDFSQYGLGAEGLTLAPKTSPKTRLPEKSSKHQLIRDFENDYSKYAGEQTVGQRKQQNSDEPVLQIDVEYQDETANFSSPFHGVNSDWNNKLNYTSNEYQTRMDYQFKHLTSKASFNYSPDSYGFGQYYNYGLGVSVPIKDIFSLETRYGWNKFDKQTNQGGLSDYQDWRVGVSTIYKGMKLQVDYIDMNASEKSQDCGKLFSCEGKTVFSIIKNF